MEDKKVVTFRGEQDEDLDFEIADSFEMNGNKYVALIPPEDALEDDEDASVLFMRIESETDSEDVFVVIEDDDELDRAFCMFKDRCGDEYDFID